MSLMVVSAHPDDETLGAGGTILKYRALKHEIFWLNFTNILPEYGFSSELVRRRQQEIETVNQMYEFDKFYCLNLRPAGLEEYSRSEIIAKVSEIITESKPDFLIIPYKNDIHSDHRVVFEIMHACSKIFRYPSIKRILMMEIVSETDFACCDGGFLPNYFVDISDFLEQKINIIKIYQSELKTHPFPRSEENIRALATYRGATAGCRFAESFVLLKAIE